jgi:hypothetical protein
VFKISFKKTALKNQQKSLQVSEGSLNNFHGINSHVIPMMGIFVARRGIEPLFPE